ncbi:MAG: DEAD/DEAH box helicase [Deltaproteobacteria bacterium]|nr:DEAD/DEAH box helicase [Deltaproteobacteria bacterium]
MTAVQHSPGSLVRARGREWIVLSGSDAEVLRVRPISGSEDDQTLIHIGLETDPVTDASFPLPDPRQKSGHDAALLLRDALLLSLQRGAGPLRCFGQIAVEPRAYQLVPLLMALKLEPVRLLIGDDVGIGKTIEAGLIAREMLDRGEVQRIAVLCPPHLVDQWITELETHFHIRAVAVTATSAARLERNLPPSESIFSAHPHTVVSLDYIKSEKRRSEFLRACPELVIVDEAHTCASTGAGRHQRYELLKGLRESEHRHLVLLTATPHSGDEAAFYRLLGLLHPDFEQLAVASGGVRDALRGRLAAHFVQRRRVDIQEWKESNLFPKREKKELLYKLTGPWHRFFDAVLDYCADIVGAEDDERRKRLSYWGTLALLRCAASSPVAAVAALRTRAGLETGEDERDALLDRVFDGSDDSLPDDDVEPPAGTDDPKLAALIASAEELAGRAGDPKLEVLTEHLRELIEAGFNPVVFCRYITTAHYLGRHLAGKLKNVALGVITGELTSDERRARVEALCDSEQGEQRLLIATDCLSEGVNLQDGFDAIVHYDLSWNPTRHEQREGRVDRFGQKKPVVRATLMYGANNPVDGAVLEVILRKAEKIREELGVPVPVPTEGASLTEVLLKSVLLKRRGATPSVEMKQLALFDTHWRDAAENAKRNRTVFAQRRLKPDDVLPEWKKTLAAVGGREDVHRFTDRALARLGSGLETQRRGFKAPLGPLPEDVRDRLESEGLSGTLLVDFAYPAAPRCRPIQRSHPLVSVLAETLLERTLAADIDETARDPGVLGRVGCWVSSAVNERTTILLLRLRHQLVTQKAGRTSTLLVEEATALAWKGSVGSPIEGEDALALLAPPPSSDPPSHVRDRGVAQALEQLKSRRTELDAFAERRAHALLADHRRVREAADARGSYSVKALLPADVIGLFVLLPTVS